MRRRCSVVCYRLLWRKIIPLKYLPYLNQILSFFGQRSSFLWKESLSCNRKLRVSSPKACQKACPAILVAELLLRSGEFWRDYSLPHDLTTYAWRWAKILSLNQGYTKWWSARTLGIWKCNQLSSVTLDALATSRHFKPTTFKKQNILAKSFL